MKCGSGNLAGEGRTKSRIRSLMIRTDKKRHRAIEIADPDFGGTGVEVEDAFFVDFALGVGRRKHFDTDFRRRCEDKGALTELDTAADKPNQVRGFDSVGGGYRALGQSAAVRKKIFQKITDLALPIGVDKTWRRSHEDVSVSIGLDAVRKLRQARVRHDFCPTVQIESGLRLEIRKLDRDRHAGKIREKWENA
jgi:hypothetical protein